MIVSYAIDWSSLYEVWFVQKAEEGLNVEPLNELRLRLTTLRKGIERNGIVFVDRGEMSLKAINRFMHGLDELIGTFSADDAREHRIVAACTRLQDELKVFGRWCRAAENRILLKASDSCGNRPFVMLQESANEYLRSTRLNRKKYRYPAVALSEDEAVMSCDDGLTKRSLSEYENCDEERRRAEWSNGMSFSADRADDLRKAFAALSIAAGTDGRIGFYDPYWSKNMLVDPPAKDWVRSTRLLLEFLVPNRYLDTITFCSADELSKSRLYHFEALVGLFEGACKSSRRNENLKVRIELRDETITTHGRRVFHNRYVHVGRFLLQVPNGIDITDQDGNVRTFDMEFASRDNVGFSAIANGRFDSSFTGKDIRSLVHDHHEYIEAADCEAVACFLFAGGRPCLPPDIF